MGKDRKPLGTLAVVALAAVLLSGIALAVDVDAARGGKGGGGGKPSAPAGTLTVSPNPAAAGITAVTVSGSQFRGNEGLSVGIPGVIPSYSIATDANGNFSFTYTKSGSAPFSAGEYPFEAHRWQSGRWQLAASTTLVVQ